MKKKLISSILVISILVSYLPVFTNFNIIPESEAAATQMVWEFQYTGQEQTVTLPYKGIYKIEAYGAQGGNLMVADTSSGAAVRRDVLGGKGSYRIGEATFDKNTVLSIHVGGQDGYNGGGNSYYPGDIHITEYSQELSEINVIYPSEGRYANGGGATDIRMGGTATSNRILVAGGGGGAYAEPHYHYHTGNKENVTGTSGCYKNYSTTTSNKCTATLYQTDKYQSDDGVWHGGTYTCPHHGGVYSSASDKCSHRSTTTTWHHSIICGKEEGVDIDEYECIDGSGKAESNNEIYKGSKAGGGGYYGGQTQCAGTSYNSTSFSNVTAGENSREGNGYVKITLLKSYPEVSVNVNSRNYTNQNLTLTATARDELGGLKASPYSWQGGTRTAANTYTISKNGTYNINVINNYDLTATASISINNIDKIAPVVNSIGQSLSANKKQTVLTVNATDTGNADYAASGVAGYAITTTNTAPAASSFQASNQFTVNKNGTYYAWAKDVAGNISQINGGVGSGSSTIVKNLEINIEGNITWNDQNNKYNSRKATTMHIYRKVGANGAETKIADIAIVPGQTNNYSFQTRECDDNGNRYIFRIAEDYIEGYEISYEGNNIASNQTQNVRINIINNIVLPTYTSKIEYNLIEGFRGEYLKNTKLEMVATVEASRNNQGKTGVNNSKVAYLIDDGFTIDKNNIEVIYTDGITGKETKIEDYMLQKNNLIVEYGEGENHVTKPGDKLTIKVIG